MAEPPPYTGPSGEPATVQPSTGIPTDIIELVMADHRRIRRLCGALNDAIRWSTDPGSGWMPAQAWERLAGLLEEHTRAEEEVCYLPMFRCLPHASVSRRGAIDEHDDIRGAIGEARLQRPGSVPWWRAVRAAVAASAEHLDREERGVLPQSLHTLTPARRRELGRQWCACIASWRQDAAIPAGGQPGTREGLPPVRSFPFPADRG